MIDVIPDQVLFTLPPAVAFIGGTGWIVVIAANSDLNLPFIVAMQTAPYISILFAGPAPPRFLAGRERTRA